MASDRGQSADKHVVMCALLRMCRLGATGTVQGMTDQAHPVLVGIDGTPSGLEALALASALATLTGSPLLLCAVHGPERSAIDGLGWPPQDEAHGWLMEAGERLGDTVPWSAQTVASSSVAHGLVAYAGETAAAMIVLGSSRHGPVGRLLAGCTARSVAHGAPCAVAVTPRAWRLRSSETPLTMGAAITDSPESHDALAFAERLAAAAHATLRVLTAVPLDPPTFAATGTGYAAWCGARREYEERVACAAATQVATGTSAETVVMEGDPVERLADASCDLDFLIVGSRRYGPLRTALLGSVSSALIERASCPLIIVARGTHPAPRSAASVAAVAHA